MTRALLPALMGAALLLVRAAEAKGPPEHAGGGKGRGKPENAGPARGGPDKPLIEDTVEGAARGAAEAATGARFSGAERDAIRGYFKRHRGSLPPGLAKRDSLPPGLQKQLDRTGRLPPGLRGEPLPRDLDQELPPTPEDVKRVIVGDDVVLKEAATDMVLDVIRDVLEQETGQ